MLVTFVNFLLITFINLTVPNLQIQLYCRYTCIGKNIVYIGIGTISAVSGSTGEFGMFPHW